MGRRLALLLIVYVTLDFANPLMPGAVRLAPGGVETVEANRAVRPEPPAPAPAAALPVETLAPVVLAIAVRPGRAALVAPSRPRLRRPAPRGALPSPSPDGH